MVPQTIIVGGRVGLASEAASYHISSQWPPALSSSIHFTANLHHGQKTDGKKTFCGLRRGRLENGQLERRLETTPKTLELSTPTRTPRSNLSIPTPQRLHLSRKGMDRQPRRL
jgi:hypothetical protein